MGGEGSGRRVSVPKPEETQERVVKPEKVKEWSVRINGQKDWFDTLDGARAYARKLIDAGVWFIRLDKDYRE